MIKRIFSVILAMMFLPVFAASAETAETTDYAKNIQLLYSLGIVDGTYAALNKETTVISDGIVNDVIYKFSGYNTGDTESYADITTGGAAAKLICALGYGYMVSGENTDVQYFVAAQNLGLLKGTAADSSAQLKSGVFAKMIVNALDIEMMTAVKIGEEAKYVPIGSYLKINNITKRTGMVEATHETSIYMPEGTSNGRVLIDDVQYVTETDMRPYLGYAVEYWTKETSDSDFETLLCAFPKSCNEEITIEADDIESVSNDMSRIEYYVENEKVKKADLASDFALIYNGKYRLKKEAAFLEPSIGRITLLDNDGDGRYDIVSVKAYDVYIVNYIYDNVIYDVNGKTPLDLSDEDNVGGVMKNGEETSVKYIMKDDVVYAAVSANGKYIEIDASSQKLEGTVTAIEEIGDYRYYTIDGEKYLASKALETENLLNGSGKFYFGPTGIIERQIISHEGKYGILLAAAEKSGIGDDKQVKIFTENGKAEVFYLEDNAVLYDGTQTKIGAAQLAKLADYANSYVNPPQSADVTTVSAPIVMYTLGEKGVKSISLPELYDDENSGSDRGKYTLQSVTEKDNMLYRRGYNRYMPQNRSFNASTNENLSDGKSKFVNSKTLVFEIVVEEDGTIPANYEDNIRVSGGDKTYPSWVYGSFYNFDDDRIAGVMVQYTTKGKAAELHGMLIKSNVKSLNEDGEECVVLNGYRDGKEVTYEVKNDVVISTTRLAEVLKNPPNVTADSLKKGDYIFIETDYKNRIIHISPMLLADYDNSEYTRYHNSVTFEDYGEIIFGEVVKVRDKCITLKLDSNYIYSDQLTFYETNHMSAVKALYDKEKNFVSEQTGTICKGDYVLIMRDNSAILDMLVRR